MAAFGQSNEGDVSPNTKGAHCLDTGKPCEFNHSTCNGKVSRVFTTQIFLHFQNEMFSQYVKMMCLL